MAGALTPFAPEIMSSIRDFVDTHYHHYNAREVRAAARAWVAHAEAGGRTFVTLAGAMSTARFGRILARAIRAGLVHGISCTGANLEEDVFNLVAGSSYRPLPHWRAMTADQDEALYRSGFNRVTDTAIPDDIMFAIEEHLYVRWRAACECERQATPAEFLMDVLRDPAVKAQMQRPEESWLLAADEKGIPVFTPGWEDSTTGNAFAAAVIRGVVPHHGCVLTGTAQMERMVRWYLDHCDPAPGIGYFQIGGGIAGDFAICVVPLLLKDLEATDTPQWGWFCQISDAITSYGGYSGAPPNEKISWGKLGTETPRFMIQSDATIVAPLILAYVLGD